MNKKYFTEKELACHCCGVAKMDGEFMEQLEAMREVLDFPFVISSGYRCPKHNQNISTTGSDGPHTLGRAVDIVISGEKAFELIVAADTWGMTGIGVSQKGEMNKRFIHLDNLQKREGYPRPWVWSY